MQKSNRRGLAIGAVFALMGSLLGAAPSYASAADGAHIGIYPLSNADTANFNGLLNEDFPVFAELLPGETNAEWTTKKNVLWIVERVSGAHDILAVTATSSGSIVNTTTRASASANIVGFEDSGTGSATVSSFVSVWAGSTSATVSGRILASTDVAPLYIRATTASPGLDSSSAVTIVKVTAFIDESSGQNGKLDASEWRTSVTITLHPTSGVPVTKTVTQPAKGDTVLTASATIGTLNLSNLDNKVFLALVSNQNGTFTGTAGDSGTNVTSSALTGAVASARSGVVSESFTVGALTESSSISVEVRYAATATDETSGVPFGLATNYIVTPLAASVISAEIVANANATDSGTAATATVRANQTYTFKFGATTGSANASVSGAVLTVAMTSDTATLAAGLKSISVNGGASTTSWAGAYTVTTGADGSATFTVATSNFANADAFTISATLGNVSDNVTVTTTAVGYTLAQDYATLATTPGTAVTATYTVVDNWLVAAPAGQTRLFVTKGGTGFAYATTTSTVAVTGGVASFAFTPEAATKTGSATVVAQLQQLDPATLAFANGSLNSVTTTVNVTATANAIVKGMKASYSATVSYFPSTVSFTPINDATVANTGSTLVASGAGLIFKDGSGATASETISLRAGNNGAIAVSVTSLLAGTYTMTLTSGATSTTSQIIVAPAFSDYGVSITFDTTNIVPGKTRIVTGTVKDANGNPVSTAIAGSTTGDAGTASILVTYAGTAGIPVGAMPTETDASGNFQLSVLTSATDNGAFTITATYLPQGAATITAKKVSAVQTITVGTAAASADQKVNVGSFKGYVALYAKGYAGQKMTAIVAGKWIKVDALASGFERVVRYTGAGYTITTKIYIDGVQIGDAFTTMTK